MIYNFDFVPNHGIYRLHSDVLSFFEQAQNVRRFNVNTLFNPSLQNIFNDSHELQRKFRLVFQNLNRAGIDKTIVYNFLSANNDIVSLLSDTNYLLLELPQAYAQLKQAIFDLYDFLWTKTLGTDTCFNNYGSIDNHYTAFYNLNSTKRICAFCGLEKVKRAKEQRNEYDHYLNRSEFKWASVNFCNLVPMCGTCNKRPNKGTKIMIFFDDTTQRRLAYYPYSPVLPVTINVDCQNLFAPNEAWTIDIGTLDVDERFTSWKNVFNIDTRYRNVLEEDYKDWLIDLYAELGNIIPENPQALRAAIQTFLTKRENSSRKPSDFIEFSFWRFLIAATDFDLQLILDHLEERQQIIAA